MKRNLILGIILISAAALSSCSSTNQLAKSSSIADDVYYSKAQAGDRTEYINDPEYLAEQEAYSDDYYYYGDYASRINRFGYYSPFNYGSSIYSPYASRFSIGLGMGFGSYGYDPIYSSFYGPYGMGLGLGYGGYYGSYGYSPYYDLGYYYGYNPYFGYGGGYGYGMGYYGGYGTIYGGAGSVPQRARPTYAGGNDPAINRAIRSNSPSQNQAINGRNSGRSINSVNGNRNANGTGARPVRESRPQQVDRTPRPQIFNAPSNFGGGNSGGGGGGGGGNSGGGGGGGGGGRPVRP